METTHVSQSHPEIVAYALLLLAVVLDLKNLFIFWKQTRSGLRLRKTFLDVFMAIGGITERIYQRVLKLEAMMSQLCVAHFTFSVFN